MPSTQPTCIAIAGRRIGTAVLASEFVATSITSQAPGPGPLRRAEVGESAPSACRRSSARLPQADIGEGPVGGGPDRAGRRAPRRYRDRPPGGLRGAGRPARARRPGSERVSPRGRGTSEGRPRPSGQGAEGDPGGAAGRRRPPEGRPRPADEVPSASSRKRSSQGGVRMARTPTMMTSLAKARSTTG